MSKSVPGVKVPIPGPDPRAEADVHLDPAPKPVVVDFPTIMDGWVVRWYATEDDANHGEQVISASRNGVLVHQECALAEQLRADADEVASLIAGYYGEPFGRPPRDEPLPWARFLTHVRHMFRDVEPITGGAA